MKKRCVGVLNVAQKQPAYKTRFPEGGYPADTRRISGGYPADIRPPDGFSVTSRMEPVLVSLFKGDNAKIRQFYSNDFNLKQPC